MMRAILTAILLLALGATAALAAPQSKGPEWAALTADQQQVLAPLAADWNKLSAERKRKWLGIAKRYPAMAPEEQKRVQARMQRWAKLTPELRWQARERFRNIVGKMAPDRHAELRRYWAQYQALPPHEKRMFDVPPSYVPPVERRKRVAPARPDSGKLLPASL